MCRWDSSDSPEVYRHVDKRAAKPHRCDECGRTIEIGETYRYTFMVYDGFAESYHECRHCRAAARWLIENCGGYLIQGVHEELEEHAQEYPRLAKPLRRLCDGIRRKWRGPRGGMMRLPKMPPPIELKEAA